MKFKNLQLTDSQTFLFTVKLLHFHPTNHNFHYHSLGPEPYNPSFPKHYSNLVYTARKQQHLIPLLSLRFLKQTMTYSMGVDMTMQLNLLINNTMFLGGFNSSSMCGRSMFHM